VTIVSLQYRFIFLKTRKTAGSSIEQWLTPHLGKHGMIATAAEGWPLPVPFWATPDPTTRFMELERTVKKRIRKLVSRPAPLKLREHMSAAKVRSLVGEETWQGCYKFCVERQPWDRLISFWRWRQRRFDSTITLDEFLDLLEHAPDTRLVRNYSNLPIYTIEGRLAVDRVVRYETLAEELAEICERLRIPASVTDLPRAKGGVRAQGDDILRLSPSQIERIGRLSAKEIELFGWPPPHARDEPHDPL
jgi:hypothetical protein